LTEDKWKTLGEIADVLEVWLYNSIKRTFIFPSLQPFLEVTLQMSHNKIPTIPFVLPVYHKMEKHLEAVSTSWEHSFKIQHASEQGLAKLRKYFIPAKLHHSIFWGLVSCFVILSIQNTNCSHSYSFTPMFA